MTLDGAVSPVRRIAFSTGDEAETENLMRGLSVGNRSRFHAVPAGARFTVTVAGRPKSRHLRRALRGLLT